MKYVRNDKHCKVEAYDKNEVDNLLGGKASATHNHDEKYYTESEIDAKFNAEADIYSGTTDPSSSLGKNGDIYLKYS